MMKTIIDMVWESSFLASINAEIERYLKGQVHSVLDYDNDRLKIYIIDLRSKVWQYSEYDLANKLVQGKTSEQFAHDFISAYKKKILHEFFKKS